MLLCVLPGVPKPLTVTHTYHNAQSLFLTPLVPEDILSITNQFKQKNSYGADGVSIKLLTKTIDKIINPITHIMNLTFETGLFPNDFKCAKVIPIFKAGTLNNYRPISLLSSFSIFVEKAMYTEIKNFLADQYTEPYTQSFIC